MLQHDSFGYNKIKKTNKKCCCIRKYCLVLNLPQYKTIFLIHLCLFNSRDISMDFFLLDQFSNRHDNRANELALSLMHDDSCAFFTLSEIGFRPPRAARASSRMLVLPQWGRGDVSESLMPWPVQACWVLPSFFAWIFLSVMGAFFLSFWILHRWLSRFIFAKRTMHHFKGFHIFQIWAPKLRTYIFTIAVPLGSCLSGVDVGHSCSKMPGPFQAYWLYLGLPSSSFWFFWVSLGRGFFVLKIICRSLCLTPDPFL